MDKLKITPQFKKAVFKFIIPIYLDTNNNNIKTAKFLFEKCKMYDDFVFLLKRTTDYHNDIVLNYFVQNIQDEYLKKIKYDRDIAGLLFGNCFNSYRYGNDINFYNRTKYTKEELKKIYTEDNELVGDTHRYMIENFYQEIDENNAIINILYTLDKLFETNSKELIDEIKDSFKDKNINNWKTTCDLMYTGFNLINKKIDFGFILDNFYGTFEFNLCDDLLHIISTYKHNILRDKSDYIDYINYRKEFKLPDIMEKIKQKEDITFKEKYEIIKYIFEQHINIALCKSLFSVYYLLIIK